LVTFFPEENRFLRNFNYKFLKKYVYSRVDVPILPPILRIGSCSVLKTLTLIAISECIAVNVEGAVSEEEEAEPRLERVDGNDEQDPDDVALLGRVLVVDQVLVDLCEREKNIEITIVSKFYCSRYTFYSGGVAQWSFHPPWD
jgi:hypothetical protein